MPFSVPLAVSCAALILAISVGARARTTASECEVVLRPAEAEAGWQEAVRDLRSWLNESSGRDVDCGGIEVRADGDSTSIVFTTADGRRAERPVPAPAQLLAVVEALTITIPEPPRQPDPPPALPARSAPDDRPRAAVRAIASPDAKSTLVLIHGRGGMRLPGAAPCSSSPTAQRCTFGALSFGVGLGINVGYWDLGVFGQYDPTQVLLSGSTPPGFAMSSYAVGLSAGRRQPVGPLDAIAGATAAIAVTDESSQDQATQTGGQGGQAGAQGGQTGGPSTAEPRVGFFAGFVVPRRGRVRLRPELALDVVASRLGQSYRVDSALPLLPWWSASASVGVEWEAP
jgi:hypothetical protein